MTAAADDATDATMEVTCKGVEAQLFVADVQAACDFYAAKLGLRVVFVNGEPPHYAQVGRGPAVLNLRQVCEPVFAGDVRERLQLLSATFPVASAADMRRLDADFVAKGVDFHERLAKKPWGAFNIIVRDPDGNLILFAGPGE